MFYNVGFATDYCDRICTSTFYSVTLIYLMSAMTLFLLAVYRLHTAQTSCESRALWIFTINFTFENFRIRNERVADDWLLYSISNIHKSKQSAFIIFIRSFIIPKINFTKFIKSNHPICTSKRPREQFIARTYHKKEHTRVLILRGYLWPSQ